MISLRHSFIIAFKEIQEFFKDSWSIIYVCAFTLGWPIFYFFKMFDLDIQSMGQYILNAVFTLSLMMGMLIGMFVSSQAFIREKYTKSIETLLCAPISLRTVWFGKVLGAFIPSYFISLLISILILILANVMTDASVVIPLQLIVFLVTVVPLILIAFIGFYGFFQLLVGMKENRLSNMIIMGVIMGVLFGIRTLLEKTSIISWWMIAAGGGIAIVLIIVVSSLIKLLNKERIITTIP